MAVQPGSAPAVNPYAAPQAVVDDAAEGAFELASRWARLGAALLDGLVFFAGNLVIWKVSGKDFAAYATSPYTPLWFGMTAALGLVNLYLLHRYRATIGKLAARIRIVAADGSETALWRIVFLRTLPQWIVGAIPLVNLLTLVDVLFIFGTPKRCVHDYIAGTIVVREAKR